MNSGNIIIYGLLLIAVTVGIAVQSNENFDIKTLQESLNWENVELGGENELIRASETAINGLGETFFHIIKYIAELSSKHPEVPYKLILFLVLFAIFAPILLFLIKSTIILIIILGEWKITRKEKRELRRLQKQYERTYKERNQRVEEDF